MTNKDFNLHDLSIPDDLQGDKRTAAILEFFIEFYKINRDLLMVKDQMEYLIEFDDIETAEKLAGIDKSCQNILDEAKALVKSLRGEPGAELKIGNRVRLHDFIHTGQTGIIQERHSSGRHWNVKIDDGKIIMILEANLRLISG